jgi:uncharacterized Zn finger protein
VIAHGPCPKCGSEWRRIKYVSGCQRGTGREHLAVTCETCGYVERQPCLDARQDPQIARLLKLAEQDRCS